MHRMRKSLSHLCLPLALWLFFVILPLTVIGVTVCSLATRDDAVREDLVARGAASSGLEATTGTLTIPQDMTGLRPGTSAITVDAWRRPQARELP